MHQPYARIVGTGSYLPERVLTNQDLEKMVDTSDEWIVERTGIHARHIAAEHETASSMAEHAARKALAMAELEPEMLDLIIIATAMPDRAFPGTACILQHRLGIAHLHCPSFDLNSAACAGFMYAFSIADKFIRCGNAKHALVVGSELMSRMIDWTDRTTCVLFGDGAGAFVLSASEEPGILSTHMHADGSHQDILYMHNVALADAQLNGINRPRIYMKGNPLFKLAVNTLGDLFDETLKANNIKKDEVDWLVPHQANVRIIQAMAKKLSLPMDQVAITLDKQGNTSSASIPLAFDKIVRQGVLKKGETLLLEGFGGGLVWASALLKYI